MSATDSDGFSLTLVVFYQEATTLERCREIFNDRTNPKYSYHLPGSLKFSTIEDRAVAVKLITQLRQWEIISYYDYVAIFADETGEVLFKSDNL
jgi:hypothetical protein